MPVPVQKEERPVNPLGQPARYWPGKAPSAEVVQRPKKVEKPKEAITIIKYPFLPPRLGLEVPLTLA